MKVFLKKLNLVLIEIFWKDFKNKIKILIKREITPPTFLVTERRMA